MTAAQRRRKAVVNMEVAAQLLIASAYTLCAPEGHSIWQRRDHSVALLANARRYANAVAAMRRS